MEFEEKYDLNRVQYLDSLTITQMKPYLGNCKNDDERRIKFNKIKRFSSGIIKNRGLAVRQYAYSLSTPLETGGRLFSGCSIQGVSKPIRGFLLDGITTDIDLVNAHPIILSYLCKKHSIHCAELDNYIRNRSKILAQFDDRDKAKKLFLTAVNSEKTIRCSHSILKKFDREMKYIQQSFADIDEYKCIRDSVPDDKKDGNWNGCTVNRILCMWENKILQVAISVCNKIGLKVFAPMFDGLLVYGSVGDDVLAEITSAVENAFPGLNAQWTFKDHDTSMKIHDGWVYKEAEPVKEDVILASNDIEAAEIVFKTLRGKIIYSDGVFYLKRDNLWISDESQITSYLQLIVLKSKIYRVDKKGEISDYTQNLRNASAVASCVMKLVMEARDDNWVQSVFSSSHGYVLFTNGYFNFRTATFHANGSDGFDESIIFTEQIPYEYDQDFTDEEKIKYVDDVIFKTQFGEEIGEYYKLQIARGLAGDCMKRFLVGIGPSNSGKSMISLCLKMSCGGYYDGWNGANISLKSNISDEAQRLRWMFLLKDKRLIVSNELSTNISIDGNMLKKMSNGGKDDITGRLHGGNETKFRVGFLPILFAQDLPKITPYDDAVETRIRSIPYTKTYVNNPSNVLELKRDPNLEDDVCTDSFRQAFLRLLFRAYHSFHISGRHDIEPDMIRSSTKDVVGSECSPITTWLETFEITENKDDYVLSSDIQRWIDSEKLGITMMKFGQEMKRHCLINNFTSVEVCVKKLGGKPCRVWVGCKIRSDE